MIVNGTKVPFLQFGRFYRRAGDWNTLEKMSTVEVGVYRAGRVCLGEDRLKILGMRNVFSEGSRRFSRWSQ